MRAIAVGLDLDEMFFEDKINEQYHNLRLLSYPPVKTSVLKQEGQARAGAHSGALPFSVSLLGSNVTPFNIDYGTLTLLFQDSVGGLEVENPHTNHFQPAKPIVSFFSPASECLYLVWWFQARDNRCEHG